MLRKRLQEHCCAAKKVPAKVRFCKVHVGSLSHQVTRDSAPLLLSEILFALVVAGLSEADKWPGDPQRFCIKWTKRYTLLNHNLAQKHVLIREISGYLRWKAQVIVMVAFQSCV